MTLCTIELEYISEFAFLKVIIFEKTIFFNSTFFNYIILVMDWAKLMNVLRFLRKAFVIVFWGSGKGREVEGSSRLAAIAKFGSLRECECGWEWE